MADDGLNLPGDFQPGKNHLIKGDTMLAWKKELEGDRVIPGPGIKETDTGKGRSFRIEFPPTDYAPFALKQIEPNGTDFDLTFEPGRVVFADPIEAANSRDGYGYFIPEINGEPMDVELPTGKFPALTVSPGQAVFCKVNRGEIGQVIPPVQLVAAAQNTKSDFYQPDDPSGGGNESEFDYIRILFLDVVSGEVEIKIWRKSDIQMSPFLWTGENIGGGIDLFKEHDEVEGTYKFRTPKGCWGTKMELDGDLVVVELDAKNVGAGVSASAGEGATLLVEKSEEDPALDLCGEAAKVKSLLQGFGADEKQIRMTNDDEHVRIHGNGKNGARIFKNCEGVEMGRIEWQDGLITSEGEIDVTVGDCNDTTPS